MSQDDFVARGLGYVLGPPVGWVGRHVERRVRRRLPPLPVPSIPDLPDPPWWFAPVVVGGGTVGAVVAELLSEEIDATQDDPDQQRSEPEREEPEAERAHHPASEDDPLAEALGTLDVEDSNPEREVVRVAYRSLVKETHPDAGGDAERFKEVQAAWEVVQQREQLSTGRQSVEATKQR